MTLPLLFSGTAQGHTLIQRYIITDNRRFTDDHPVTVIENQSAPDGPTLLMVKDSFGNTLAPLLVPSYGKIVLVDPRYYRGSVAELCAEQGADEILFCYSLERICTDLNLSILK